jgi:hypothetical protein
MSTWPTAQLDPVGRLRVLAAALPNGVLVERELAVPFERLWEYIADLERSVPQFDRTVGRLTVHERAPLAGGSGERISAVAGMLRGPGIRFDVRLEPGFCWMVQRQRLYVVGMAASPIDAEHVRYAHLEGVPRRGSGVAKRWLARHVRHDVDGIAGAVEIA